MADRDTTASPYLPSADGLVYFRYPAGNAPVVQVVDYAELRTKGSADAGGGYRIAVTDAGTAGAFAWRSNDIRGNGDDGGMVIAATDGWWYRVYAYGRNRPVELSWYEFSSGDDSTVVFEQLFAAYPAGVAVRMPDFAGHIVVNTISVQIPEFTLLGGVTELWQHAAPTDDYYVFRLDNVSYLNVDAALVCRGRYGAFGVAPGNQAFPGGFFAINEAAGNLSYALFYPRIYDTTGLGLKLGGNIGQVTIGSWMQNSGALCGVGGDTLHYDNAYFSDPDGNGLKDYTQNLYEKWHGMRTVGYINVTGKITLQYGGEHWFLSNTINIGASESEPFIVEQNDIGYAPDGQPNGDAPGIQWNGGKMDGLSQSVTALGSRFLRCITTGHNRQRHHWVQLEASTEGQNLYATSYVNIDYVVTNQVTTGVGVRIGVFNPGLNECKGHRFTGDVPNMSNTSSESVWDGCEIGSLAFVSEHQYAPLDNIINGGTVSGVINFKSGTLTMNDVTFTGAPRTIIPIENAEDNVVLRVNNLTAPPGSVIELTTADPDPQFYLDGALTPLPYTVP
jgi:hypothetical protein